MSYSSLLFVWKVQESWGEAIMADKADYGEIQQVSEKRYLCRGNTSARNQVCVFLMHSALGRLGVHKSFIVDVTTHFGSSIPSPKLL